MGDPVYQNRVTSAFLPDERVWFSSALLNRLLREWACGDPVEKPDHLSLEPDERVWFSSALLNRLQRELVVW